MRIAAIWPEKYDAIEFRFNISYTHAVLRENPNYKKKLGFILGR